MQPLSLRFLGKLPERLGTLADDETSMLQIKNFLKNRKRAFLWEQYKVALIILFTIFICMIIYFTGK
jgi:uncharacterized membrane protein